MFNIDEKRVELRLPTVEAVEEFFDLEDCTAFCDSIWGDDVDRDNPRLSVLVHNKAAITAKHVDDRRFWDREVRGIRP